MRGTDTLSSRHLRAGGAPAPASAVHQHPCTPVPAALRAHAAVAVLCLSLLFSAYLHHELAHCSLWGTSVLIGSDEPVSTCDCGGERCHIWGRWLPIIARLLLGTPSGLRCHPRDEKRLRWDTGWGDRGQCQVRSAPGARSQGSGSWGWPAVGNRPVCLHPVPGPCMNAPAMHPHSGPEPFHCVCAGELGSLPTLPPLLWDCLPQLALFARNSWGQSVSSQGEVTGGDRKRQCAKWGLAGRSPCAGRPHHVRGPGHTPQHLADPMGRGWCEEIGVLSM